MKNRNPLILLISVIMAVFFLQGCEKTDVNQTGSINFGMSPVIENTLKSLASSNYDVSAALVTIVNEVGTTVYDKEFIEFFSFGESFITKSLNLKIGNYQLTEFLLVDSSRNVIWATPVEGSRLAHLVNDPVPIEISIYADNTTQVFPQVVRVGSYNPNYFGYVHFHVDFIDNFCIGVFFESFCNNWYMDSIMIRADGFAPPYFSSRLALFSEGEMLMETYLNPGENKISIPRGHDIYNIVVSDCGNQTCFEAEFGIEELKHYSCAEGERLFINCEPDVPDVILTPDDITEPTIDQGVFGKITEPGWDSTMNDDYAIHPLVTDLYIYKAEQGDTVYFPMPTTDCYVYPDIYMEPLAVVRTNTSGFYQLPLEEGRYNYMVKSVFGFYIDAYVSSHYPGVFDVVNGEVTILNIYVNPCLYF